MKDKFLKYSMNLIRTSNNFDEIRLEEIKYGLEGFYMLITKLAIIFGIAICFNLFKELLLFMLFFTPLRGLGFGFHANSSKECWLITIPTFILLPYLAKTLVIPKYLIITIILAAIISFSFFAPADTEKRPLINRKKRIINKLLIILISIVYLIITLVIDNNLFINIIAFCCLWQAICVNPITYKLFHQSYNNYKTYLNEV